MQEIQVNYEFRFYTNFQTKKTDRPDRVTIYAPNSPGIYAEIEV